MRKVHHKVPQRLLKDGRRSAGARQTLFRSVTEGGMQGKGWGHFTTIFLKSTKKRF